MLLRLRTWLDIILLYTVYYVGDGSYLSKYSKYIWVNLCKKVRNLQFWPKNWYSFQIKFIFLIDIWNIFQDSAWNELNEYI